MKTTPFTISIGDDELEDLHRRMRHTRWPDAVEGMDWEDGTDLAFLRRLTD
ncbi:epoxide hydrolase N-terminal domain-containing protein [Streptomyces aurantiacus]|uniref:Epoxide hydrolase N-terminal domain-containing protein n=1 Tax=Streptomyces aurantiacus TaxID=47760 RepID=A0A7G1PH33_9ACTN|nr:hypothetical protein GCM10017557_81150 [Streptomyces aurantiacus]